MFTRPLPSKFYDLRDSESYIIVFSYSLAEI